MDLTIPYTFYPVALPHWIAWALFTLAMLGGLAAAVMQDARHGDSDVLRRGRCPPPPAPRAEESAR